MSESEHIIRIALHVIQAVIAFSFLFYMWKWSRRPKLDSDNKMQEKLQEDAALAEIQRQLENRKRQEEISCKIFT